MRRALAALLLIAHQEIVATLAPGVWYLVVDTFVDGGGVAHGGEYLLTVVAE